MSRIVAAALLFLATLSANAGPQPVNCGDVLFASVVLTADVVCGPGDDALIVRADNVRIDLNGYNIVGPFTFVNPTAYATGIQSLGFNRVEIIGPGTIAGFVTPIYIDSGANHVVRGIEITGESGMGVIVLNASGALIESNRLPHINVGSVLGSLATKNRIVGNEVLIAPDSQGGGIWLTGCGTSDNVVARNFIDTLDYSSVAIFEGAHGNQVLDNKIVMGKVFLLGASDNMIARNSFENVGWYTAAVEILPARATCSRKSDETSSINPASKNIVRDNRVRGGRRGVTIEGTSFRAPATGNVVTGNTFADQTDSGLFFGQYTSYNDARGNTYVHVPQVAYDYGWGNMWP